MTDPAPEETVQEESYIYRGVHEQQDADSITLLQIRDILYALLGEQKPDTLKKLADLHAEGGILGPNLNWNPSKHIDQPE
jgi:hypothetical protein